MWADLLELQGVDALIIDDYGRVATSDARALVYEGLGVFVTSMVALAVVVGSNFIVD